MVQFRLAAAAAVAACLAAACGSDTAPSVPTRTLSGAVTEAPPTASVPVANARVTIDSGANAGRSAMTGADGRYVIDRLVDGTFSLHAGAPGYDDRTGSIVLDADRVLNIQLVPTPRTVTDTIVTTISPCNGDVWIVCFSHDFVMHNAGAVTATLTTGNTTEAAYVALVATDRSPFANSSTVFLGRTQMFNFCLCAPGTYSFQIVSRLLTPVSVNLTIVHPN